MVFKKAPKWLDKNGWNFCVPMLSNHVNCWGQKFLEGLPRKMTWFRSNFRWKNLRIVAASLAPQSLTNTHGHCVLPGEIDMPSLEDGLPVSSDRITPKLEAVKRLFGRGNPILKELMITMVIKHLRVLGWSSKSPRKHWWCQRDTRADSSGIENHLGWDVLFWR